MSERYAIDEIGWRLDWRVRLSGWRSEAADSLLHVEDEKNLDESTLPLFTKSCVIEADLDQKGIRSRLRGWPNITMFGIGQTADVRSCGAVTSHTVHRSQEGHRISLIRRFLQGDEHSLHGVRMQLAINSTGAPGPDVVGQEDDGN